MSGEELRGFSRGGFAPIPRRHDDLPPLPPPPARFEREREDFDRREPLREREFPRRELDPDPELERWERRLDRDDFERGRGHPPDDPYGECYGSTPKMWADCSKGRQKRRRSPSPGGPSHRPRQYSPSPPRHGGPQHNLPDPASLDYLLNFRQFSEWFRVTHPKTAQEDLEEVHRQKEEFERGDIVSREKVGMAKRYERYRKEYFSRQVSSTMCRLNLADDSAVCSLPYPPRRAMVRRAIFERRRIGGFETANPPPRTDSDSNRVRPEAARRRHGQCQL